MNTSLYIATSRASRRLSSIQYRQYSISDKSLIEAHLYTCYKYRHIQIYTHTHVHTPGQLIQSTKPQPGQLPHHDPNPGYGQNQSVRRPMPVFHFRPSSQVIVQSVD